ncbi:MAG: phospholipid-binding protein MlaC, partial [bacterium]
MKKITSSIVGILMILLLNTPIQAAAPTDQLKKSLDGIIEVLKEQGLDREVRREKIRVLFRERFDFRIMSRRVLARNWKKTTPDIQDRFVALFADLLEAIYIGRIEEYSDERIDYINERIKEKRAIIDTVIVTKSVEIPINYKLTLTGDLWLVYDVVIEEVSL